MIGDVFGNMWNGEDKFCCNRGEIFGSKDSAKRMIEKLSEEYNIDFEWKLHIYKIDLIED